MKVSVKVEVEELEDLLGPDDVGVDFGRILEQETKKGAEYLKPSVQMV